MNIWLYAYFIGSAVALLLLVVMVFWQHDDMGAMKELSEKLRDKWAQTEARTKKLERGLEWFLSRYDMKMDFSRDSWDWNVVPVEKPGLATDDAWKQMAAHREEIVYALYEANKRALHDWDREKTNKEKKKGEKK